MARLTRSRTRTQPFTPGVYYGVQNNVPFSQTNTGDSLVQQCDDSYGRPVADSPLLITEEDRSHLVPIFWDNKASPNNRRFMEGYFLTGTRSITGSDAASPVGTEADAALTVRARTNPSRSEIVPFTLLQDLYELPRMIRDAGRFLINPKLAANPRFAAGLFLGVKFGWLPTVHDASDLFNMGEKIAQRHAELNRLYSGHGLKRHIQLGWWDGTFLSTGQFFETAHGDQLKGNVFLTTSVKRWGSIRWLPLYIPKHHPSDAETFRQAQKLVRGMSTAAAFQGLWDVIPWTWVIDWFTNLAEFMQAHNGQVPASSSTPCIMTRTVTISQITTVGAPTGFPVDLGYAVRTHKKRYVGSGGLSVFLPKLLGWDKLSVLSALGIQRYKL